MHYLILIILSFSLIFTGCRKTEETNVVDDTKILSEFNIINDFPDAAATQTPTDDLQSLVPASTPEPEYIDSNKLLNDSFSNITEYIAEYEITENKDNNVYTHYSAIYNTKDNQGKIVREYYSDTEDFEYSTCYYKFDQYDRFLTYYYIPEELTYKIKANEKLYTQDFINILSFIKSSSVTSTDGDIVSLRCECESPMLLKDVLSIDGIITLYIDIDKKTNTPLSITYFSDDNSQKMIFSFVSIHDVNFKMPKIEKILLIEDDIEK